MSMADPARKTGRRAALGRVMRLALSAFAVLATAPSLADAGEITLSARPSPTTWGTAVTLTALVTTSDGGLPSGRVVFTDDGVRLASAEFVTLGVEGGLSGSRDHVCALGADGAPWCWGAGGSGRLGNGGSANVSRPVAVSGPLPHPVAIASGGEHGCSLSRDGAVHCWGNGARGQLGTGDDASSAVPVSVPGLAGGVAAIALGASHGCVLTRAGGVRCWGAGTMRQIGDGDAVDRSAPVAVVGLAAGVTAIALGSAHGCALTEARTVACWGSNLSGQLGDGTRVGRAVPVAVPDLAEVVAISAGDLHSCAVLASGAAKCWGANEDGRLGDGTTTERLVPTAVVDLPAPLATISAGGAHTCGVTTAGAALCWGYGAEGRLGDGGTASRSAPVAVTGLGANVVAIAAGARHTCAQRSDMVVECWGSGHFGQLGDGGTAARSTPAPVLDLRSPVRARAEVTVHDLEVGRHGLVAAEDVPAGEPARVSAPVELVVGRAVSRTDLVASAAGSRRGEVVTLTATATGRVTPTGTVRFGAGSTELATVGLGADGRATTGVTLPVGVHDLTATYDGDGRHQGSASAALTHTVERGLTATTLTASADRTGLGVPLTLTAAVVPVAPAAGVVGGTVTFAEGATPLATLPLTAGGATLVLADRAPGPHGFTATANGDDDFAPSEAAPVDVEVARGATTTRLVAAATRLLPGAPLTLTARVAPVAPAGGVVAGEVDFDDGATRLGRAMLVDGAATLNVASTTTGDHPVTVRYRGSGRFVDSTSATTTVTVDPRVGPEFGVNRVTSGSQQQPVAASLAGGGHVVAWASRVVGGRSEIRARRSGTRRGSTARRRRAVSIRRSRPPPTADGSRSGAASPTTGAISACGGGVTRRPDCGSAENSASTPARDAASPLRHRRRRAAAVSPPPGGRPRRHGRSACGSTTRGAGRSAARRR